MAALGPEASAIVKAGRGVPPATTVDRDRIEAALRARLGSSALPPDFLTKPIAASVAQRFVSSGVMGMCALACALFFILRPQPSTVAAHNGVQQPPVASAAIAAPAVALDSHAGKADAVNASPTLPATPPLETVLPSYYSLRKEDRLAQEVALLLRATGALSAGRASDALKALNEHRRRFPNGILAQERYAAQAQALCSLGRVAEGRAELTHLPAQSPAANHSKQVCDSVSAPSKQCQRGAPAGLCSAR